MTGAGGRWIERRGAAALVLGLFIAGGVVFVFAGTLTRATELEQEAAQARAEMAALEGRVEAGRVELEFMESDAFIEQQARAVGFGSDAERPFRLPDGAPSPPPLVPLGAADAASRASAPLDAWLKLLFGA